MLAGSKEESPTAAWAKAKRKSTAGCCRPGLQSSHFLQSQEEEHVSQLWKTTSLFCLEISAHLLAAAQRLLSETYPNISQYQDVFCWGFFFTFYGLLEQLRASRELKTISKQRKKPSKVPAAFYSVSASKVFQGKWRCAESSSHYWQWKPLRHFRYFIAFS